jgi:hypothetical protein
MSTLNHLLFPFSSKHFQNKTNTAKQRPFQLSMTVDAAIRIDLHSAEVVHFTHKIWYIRRDQPRIVIHKVCGVRIIKRNLLLAYLSIGTYPMELFPPGKPWQSTPFHIESDPSATAGDPLCLPGGSAQVPPAILLPSSIVAIQIPGSRDPLYSCQVSHAKTNKLRVKPRPISG